MKNKQANDTWDLSLHPGVATCTTVSNGGHHTILAYSLIGQLIIKTYKSLLSFCHFNSFLFAIEGNLNKSNQNTSSVDVHKIRMQLLWKIKINKTNNSKH